MVTQRLNLNLIPDSAWPRLTASQGDTGSRVFEFTIFNGFLYYEIPEGSVVALLATKPDGYPVSYECTYDGYVVTADCPEQLTAAAGDVICELQIIKDEEILGTANFILFVEASPYNRAELSTEDMEALYTFVARAVQSAQKASG